MRTKLSNLIIVAVLGLSLTGASLYADNDKDKTNNGNHTGQIIKAEKDTPTLPPVAERPNVSPEVKKAIAQFEKDREKYLEEQKALQKKFSEATDQEREQIREQIKEKRSAWTDQVKSNAKDIKDRLKELNKPNRQDILDSAKENDHTRRGN